MKAIEINSKKHGTHFLLVSDEDFEMFKSHTWCVSKAPNTFYAITTIDGKTTRAHNLIFTSEKGYVVDHIDRNGLNNKRDNLRRCKQGQNIVNSTIRTTSRSGIKGVWYCKLKKKWKSQITVNRTVITIGTFVDKNLATIAYNEAAKKYYGEFAYLNKI